MSAVVVATPSPRSNRSPRRRLEQTLAGLLAGALLALGCGPNIETQLGEIRALQEAGQYDASIAPLRKLLSRESDDPEANLRLGIALQQTGRPSLAVWPLQKAALSDEYEVQAGLLLAATLSLSESYQESIRAYNRVLEKDAANATALFGKGKAQLMIGFPTEALASAEELLAVRPDDQLAISLKGSALLDLDRGEEAETALRGVVERAIAADDPADAARKCAALGIFYRSQEANDRAAETFTRCVASYPQNPQLRQHATDFFLDRQEPEKAIAVWRAAVAKTPEDLGLRARLSEILANLGRDESALEAIQESVELFDSPEAWRMLAAFQRNTGNLAAAREALEESMERLRTVAPSMRFTLADILIEEGNYERAAEIADSLDEPSYRAMIRGAILLKKGEAAAALEMLDSGLRLYPNNAGARYMAGEAALRIGDQDRAQAEFREAIRISETETDAALRLAELYFRGGEYLNARQFANRHIGKRPFSGPAAHVISARSSIVLEEYAQAEGTLKNLRGRAPEQPTAYLEFADLRRKQEGAAAAIEILLEGEFDLTLPKNEAILRALAQDHIALGEAGKALEAAEAARLAHPDSPGFQDLKGQILLELGRESEAQEAFTLALEKDPEYPPSLAARGSLSLTTGDFPEALTYFDRASIADPDNPHYVYLAGQARYLQSDLQGAERFYRKTLEVDPSHVGANNDLAWMMASEGRDLEAALEYATRAARLSMNADTLDTLGFVQLKAGDAKEAVGVLSKALELRPDSASIQYRLGLALAASGDKEAARKVIGNALEKPPFPEAEAARAELARLENS